MKDDPERRQTVLNLSGAATFIRLPQLAAALESVPRDRELHVHIEQLAHIDHACLDLLMNWQKQYEAGGGSLTIDWDSLTARFHEAGKNGGRRQTPLARNADGARPAAKRHRQPVAEDRE
jgi:ABC-type transporter Mla MlaB component